MSVCVRERPGLSWRMLLVTAAMCAATGCASSGEAPDDGGRTIVRNATLIDGTGGPVRRGVSVAIEDGRIVEVGPAVSPAPGATIVDGTGRTILPGFFNMHGHLYARGASGTVPQHETYAKLFLAGGVTSVFSPGSRDPLGAMRLRERIESGELPGPTIYLAGRYIDQDDSIVSWIEAFQTTAEVEEHLDVSADGLHAVKLYTGVDKEFGRKVVAFAHERGLFVTGHLGAMTARDAIDIGIDGLEHGIFAMRDVIGESIYPRVLCATADADIESPGVDELIRLLEENDVYLTPTTVVHEVMKLDVSLYSYPWSDFLSEAAMAAWNVTLQWGYGFPEDSLACVDRALENHLAFIRKAHQAGVRVLVGTDPVAVMLTPGYAIHREIRFMIDAGMSVEEAIHAASLSAAEVLGVERDYGSIEPGKAADLFVVEGDVTSDVSALFDTVAVFKNGERFDPSQLREASRQSIR